MKFILPIIFIIIAVLVFVGVTNPMYQEIQTLTVEAESYDEALANSKRLQARRDELTQSYNNFPRTSVEALETMIPSSVDNIGLIQEIQRIALRLGIVVKNVNFDPNTVGLEDGVAEEGVEDTTLTATQSSSTQNRRRGAVETNDLYETFLLEFTIEGSYDDFVAFLAEIEKNLRIVDVNSINFSASSIDSRGNFTDVYDYTFTTQTYRLMSE